MKQKTAMMELLDDLKQIEGCNCAVWYIIGNRFLEKEKSQIMDAANQTEFEDIDNYGISEPTTKGEQYYNETYKQD